VVGDCGRATPDWRFGWCDQWVTGRGVVLAAACVPPERAPLLEFGVRVFHADPMGGLAPPYLAPRILLAEAGVVLRLGRWGIGPAPHHRVRPCPSLIVVVLMVFCFFFPDTKARRPGWCAAGRRTWVSVPSIRSVTPSAAA
jgi:hypothetical protein